MKSKPILVVMMILCATVSAYAATCHYELPGDNNGDCRTDILDFALLAQGWLIDCQNTPGSPECIPLDIDGDGFDVVVDCNDLNFDINPDADEICNDGFDNDCDGFVDGDDVVDCSIPPGVVIIDEIFYDEIGTDGPNVFIELWGPPSLSLDGFSLVGVNGQNGVDYVTIDLTGYTIDGSGYFLIVHSGSALTAIADMVSDGADLQNGPDSVVLKFGIITVDALGYGSGAYVYEGSPAVDSPTGMSLSRCSHSDTDENLADFQESEPSPKSDETCGG